MNISPQQLADINRWNSTLPPFTITITDPEDANAIINAFLLYAGGSKEGAELVGIALGASCRVLGIEKGVEMWWDTFNSMHKRKLPKFLKPLIVHNFEHINNEKENGK